MKKVRKALLKDYNRFCDIWLERPPFRVILDYIEEVEQAEAEEAQDSNSGCGPMPASPGTLSAADGGYGRPPHTFMRES